MSVFPLAGHIDHCSMISLTFFLTLKDVLVMAGQEEIAERNGEIRKRRIENSVTFSMESPGPRVRLINLQHSGSYSSALRAKGG